LAGLIGAGGSGYAKTVTGQIRRHQLSNSPIVIDEQDMGR
jgi:hypothetical protein